MSPATDSKLWEDEERWMLCLFNDRSFSLGLTVIRTSALVVIRMQKRTRAKANTWKEEVALEAECNTIEGRNKLVRQSQTTDYTPQQTNKNYFLTFHKVKNVIDVEFHTIKVESWWFKIWFLCWVQPNNTHMWICFPVLLRSGGLSSLSDVCTSRKWCFANRSLAENWGLVQIGFKPIYTLLYKPSHHNWIKSVL